MKTLYKNITIPATSGKRTIAKASDVFKGWIDSDFKNWKLDKKDIATKEANLAVLEIEKDGTFRDIFGEDFKNKVLTQEQIISFCENHSEKLNRDWYNFFLFKVDDEFFVAYLCFHSDGLLKVYAYRFSDDYVWYAGYCHRIVVPATSLFDISPLNPLSLRFFEKIEKTEKCWNWTGAIDAHGYGSFSIEGLTQKYHRVSYEINKGEIPEGLVIDHICKNKMCVNPSHLRAISRIENVMIGDGVTAKNARKTHCNRNHPLSGNNLYTYKGKRYCKICRSFPQLALESSDSSPSDTLTLESRVAELERKMNAIHIDFN